MKLLFDCFKGGAGLMSDGLENVRFDVWWFGKGNSDLMSGGLQTQKLWDWCLFGEYKIWCLMVWRVQNLMFDDLESVLMFDGLESAWYDVYWFINW